MTITDADVRILLALFRFAYLVRAQIQRLVFPGHTQGRSTRKHLAKLNQAGMVSKSKMLVPYSGDTTAGAPVWYLSKKGADFLASHFDDENCLNANTSRPRADLLHHWLFVSQIHIEIYEAIQRQDETLNPEERVKLVAWVNEWQQVPVLGDMNKQRYYLHTVLREQPPLSCSPDAAFVLALNGVSKVYYLEADRDTSGVKQIAAMKTPGFAELGLRGLFKQQFPMATAKDFRVLLVTTSEGRRNRLARAISKKPGAHRWLFCTKQDLTPSTFLYEPITIDCEGNKAPLVMRPGATEETES